MCFEKTLGQNSTQILLERFFEKKDDFRISRDFGLFFSPLRLHFEDFFPSSHSIGNNTGSHIKNSVVGDTSESL